MVSANLPVTSPGPGSSGLNWPVLGEVHLRLVDLDAIEVAAPSIDLLSDDERARAARFHFERDRLRYVAGRAQLRRVLSRYLSCDPPSIRFSYTSAGKPALEPRRDLHFNLSHSGRWALLGIATCEIGVDIEEVRPVPDIEDVARRFFAPAEAAAVLSVDDASRLMRFYSCWTRKEAFVKATGEGIVADLQDFEVAIAPEEPLRFKRIRTDRNPTGWTLTAPDVGTLLVAAVAVPEASARITWCTDDG